MNSVGYGRPPVASRFQSGQSGNPKGRPKRSSSLADDVLSVFAKPVEGPAGRPSLSTAEAAMRKLAAKALAGDLAAMKRVVKLMIEIDGFDREGTQARAAETLAIQQRVAKLLGRTTLPPVAATRPGRVTR